MQGDKIQQIVPDSKGHVCIGVTSFKMFLIVTCTHDVASDNKQHNKVCLEILCSYFYEHKVLNLYIL